MRSRFALVRLLEECGYRASRAEALVRVLDSADLPGLSSDDVAGALLHWRSRYAREAYAEGALNAWDVWTTSQRDAAASQVPPTNPLDESLPGPIQSVQQTTSHSYPS
jgi:hypothetical protein